MGCFAPGTGGALYVWVLLIRVLKLAGGTDTQPLRQLSWGCQAGVRDQFLQETGATGRSSFQSSNTGSGNALRRPLSSPISLGFFAPRGTHSSVIAHGGISP